MRSGEELDGRRARGRTTRRSIVVAASALFVEQGYGSTTMTAIAAQADVAVQTVYASFKTKRAILAAALDQAIAGDDRRIMVNDRDWMHDVFHAPTAEQRLVAYAGAVRRIMDNAGDVFMVVATAATTDPDIGELAAATEARRRKGATSVIDAVVAVGALRPGLSRAEAVDVLWVLNGPAVHQQLVRRSGWSPNRYQEWLAQAFVRELLA